MIANKFAHQFTPPPIRLTGDKSKSQLKRKFHQLPLTGTWSFTTANTKDAIRLAKLSTAIDPDRMSTLHLKKLAQCAINYLTNIFNLSISTGQIPEIWHKAIIIPILKPGKDNNIGKNWRPISLLCQAAKNTDTQPFPPCSTWPSNRNTQHAMSTITVDIAAGSPNSAHRARADSCIRQCGPSTTARLCPQHQHTLNNPSLTLQLCIEQTSQSSFL